MISRTRIQLMSLLALSVTCRIAVGSEPNDANEPLGFEISSKRIAVPQILLGKAGGPKPAYAAAIAPEGSEEFFAWPRSPRVGGFLPFARADKGLSLQQREFLEDTGGVLNAARMDTFYYPEYDPNHPQALLYAMTLPDAKRMAQLYVQFARRQYNENLDSIQLWVSRSSARIAAVEKRIPEVEKSLETMQKSLEELKASVPYRTEQEALEAIGELDRMLNTAQIEIAGIRARIDVIQAYQREERRGADVASRLELMFIEEAVAMRGAEAKKQMATELRTRASRFIDLSQSLKIATDEKGNLPLNLERFQDELKRGRERLATLREQEPKIRDNEVFIYPVGSEPQPRTYRSTEP